MSLTACRFSSRVVRSASMTWKSHDFPTTVMTGVPAATSAFMLASSSTFFPTLRVIPKAHMTEFFQRILRARSKNSLSFGLLPG